MKTIKIMTLTLLRKVFCGILLISDKHPTFAEKVLYYISIIATLSPVVYVVEGLNWWFLGNMRFVSFIIFFVTANIGVGAWFHHKNNTFSWESLLKRNAVMIGILAITYTVLEMLTLTAGQNVLAESFRAVLQVSTLLYPGSKILKNVYVLSNKKFPPAFVMEKLYNFEKTGNLTELLNTENKE